MKAYRHPPNMLMALAWQDKRTISMLSTWHNADTTTSSRIIRGGQQEDIEKPVVVCDYTEHMGQSIAPITIAHHTLFPEKCRGGGGSFSFGWWKFRL